MALNNSALFRTATRFTQLFVGPRVHKTDSSGNTGQRVDRVSATIKGAVGQTADILQVTDSSDVVLFGIGPPGSAGLGAMRVAHAIYDFAVDGGASCTPVKTALIPANAILIGATVNSTVALTAAGAATLGIGTTAGSTSTSILAATAKATLSLDALLNGVPTFAAPVKMTAAGSISVLIATGPLTAGQVEIFVYYIVAAVA